MQFILLIKNKLNSILAQKRFKKFIFFGLICGSLLFYFFWTRQRAPPDDWRLDHQKSSILLSACLDKQVPPDSNSYNTFFQRLPLEPHAPSFLPYIGNGYLSVLADDKSNLYLKEGRSFGLKVPYKPFFSVTAKSQHKKALSLNIRNATIHHHHCYKSGERQFALEVTHYAHRTIPSLLVQQISINHPSMVYTSLEVKSNNHDHSNYINIHLKLKRGSQTAVVGVSSMVIGRPLTLVVILQHNSTAEGQALSKDGSYQMGSEAHTVVHTLLTYVSYVTMETHGDVKGATKRLTDKAVMEFSEVLLINHTHLLHLHTTAWNKIWRSGFGISKSLAQDSINGDRINKTLYRLLSTSRHYLNEYSFLNDSLTSPSPPLSHSLSPPLSPSLSSPLSPVAQQARMALYDTDRCYSGHHTLQSDKLWNDIRSMEEMVTSVRIWMITLEKNGCSRMLQAGAEGLLQSMVLSLGGLKFGDKHLEMSVHPSDLHRDLQFRRINYDSNTHVSISVRVGMDNRAVIYASLDRSNASFYACDAGCLDPPLLLSNDEVSLPVKLTSPLTSILYIAPDLRHINELKHAIHVQSIDHAPAHEHDLLALHRHGHRWGGLPFMFWLVLGALILVFHLFLFKLVYNEYCNNQDTRGGYARHHKASDNSIDYSEQRSSMFSHQRRFV